MDNSVLFLTFRFIELYIPNTYMKIMLAMSNKQTYSMGNDNKYIQVASSNGFQVFILRNY